MQKFLNQCRWKIIEGLNKFFGEPKQDVLKRLKTLKSMTILDTPIRYAPVRYTHYRPRQFWPCIPRRGWYILVEPTQHFYIIGSRDPIDSTNVMGAIHNILIDDFCDIYSY